MRPLLSNLLRIAAILALAACLLASPASAEAAPTPLRHATQLHAQ